MIVVAHDLPPAVRGRMKLWFVEPKANVFVSGINDSLAKEVIDYLLSNCPPTSGVMLFVSTNTPPGYRIYSVGPSNFKLVKINGMQLVVEKNCESPRDSNEKKGGEGPNDAV